MNGISPALLHVLTSYASLEDKDVAFLLGGLGVVNPTEAQKQFAASFRRQIWNVAAQEAWNAAIETPGDNSTKGTEA
jgi:hypothetical protein